MAFLLFRRNVMKGPETRNDPRRVEEQRRPTPDQRMDTGSKERTRTHFVDPYEMRSEPQPEEPGYGHGV
jgi:hypothetical protein